jgi:hypothetical protein
VIPQIKSTVANMLIILIGGPLLGAYFAWQTGELHEWAQFPNALTHGSFASAMLAIGWLLLKSPFAPRITELLQTQTKPDGTVATSTLKIIEPEPKDNHESH